MDNQERGVTAGGKAEDASKASSSKNPDRSASRQAEAGPSGTSEGGVAFQYAAVQQMTENRDHIEYQLTVREQPKHSRMCGIGEKADRRPIDPAPIVQLRVITHDRPVDDAPISSSDSAPIPPPVERRAGHGPAAPSTPGVRRGVPVTTSHGDGWEDKAWYLENPYYFMYAMLCNNETDEELHLLQDGKTRYTSGSCVSCLYHLKDIDGSHQGFFVFPDLSIRVEGVYRLKLCLFETIGHTVHHCKSIYSAPFHVYTAKRFPGMEESTPLSKSFADQGLKVRVRKQPRIRRRSSKRKEGSRSDGSDGETTRMAALSRDGRSPKRSRGSEDPLSGPPVPAPASSSYGTNSAAYVDGVTSPRGPWPLAVPRHGSPYLHADTRLMSSMPSEYFERDRLGPSTSSRRGEEPFPAGISSSQSLPGPRGFGRLMEESPMSRYPYAEGEVVHREYMSPASRQIDGSYPTRMAYRPMSDEEAYPLAGRHVGRPRADNNGPVHSRGEPLYAFDEDVRGGGRRNRMNPAANAPPGYHFTPSSVPVSPEPHSRNLMEHRFPRSPGREQVVEYPRQPSTALRTSRGTTPERPVSTSVVSERQHLYMSERGYAAPSLAAPSAAHFGTTRVYNHEPARYESRRRHYPDERYMEFARSEQVRSMHARPAEAPYESRVPMRPIAALDGGASSADAHDRPTLPPLRDVSQLPSLRSGGRHVSPIPRLTRGEGMFDAPAPRYPSSRELDPVVRSISSTPPIRRPPSGPHAASATHLPPLPTRSPSLGGRSTSQYAPVPTRPVAGLHSPDLDRDRMHGYRGGPAMVGGAAAPIAPSPSSAAAVPPSSSATPLAPYDSEHPAHYRARRGEDRPRDRAAERDRPFPPY